MITVKCFRLIVNFSVNIEILLGDLIFNFCQKFETYYIAIELSKAKINYYYETNQGRTEMIHNKDNTKGDGKKHRVQ